MMQIFKKKTVDERKRNKDIYMMLLPSVLGIALCAICLAGTTFAWFTASQTTPTQTIQTANYTVLATVTPVADASQQQPAAITQEPALLPVNGMYSLEEGGTYRISMLANGTAQAGYCQIFLIKEGNQTEYYRTVVISKGTEMTVTLRANEAVGLMIVPNWCASNAVIAVEEGVLWLPGGEYAYGAAVAEPSVGATESASATTEPTESATEPTEPADESTEPATEPGQTADPEES